MLGIRRASIPIAAAALALGPPPAGAAIATRCSAASGSAISQYCEVVPSSTGGQAPVASDRALQSTLPARIVRSLQATRRAGSGAGRSSSKSGGPPPDQRRAELLSLPAPARAASTGSSAPTRSEWSAFSALIAVLAISGAGLGALAVVARRR